jgi:mycothiol synthase
VTEPSVAEVIPRRFSEVEPRVARIDDDARAVDGHPALGDAVWLDLEHPTTDSAGFLVDDRAYAHLSASDNTAPSDNAASDNTARNDTATPRHWTLGVAVAPEARSDGTRRALVAAAVRHVAAHGGGRIVLWVLGARAEDDAELAAEGLRPARDLYEMRVGLPITWQPKWPAGVRVRPFEVGRDEAPWLELNNRAFAGHPEQGGWTASTLARRTAEPWFEPALFLVAFDADGLVGFNWMKIHAAHDGDPALGEIYVIGVDPRAQGTGLGRALAIAGLQAVHERGIDTGMLFCAADNEAAFELYRSLGFDVHRVDRAYECEVPPV